MHSHICMAEAREGLLRAVANRVIIAEVAKREASQQKLNESAARINAALQQAYQRCSIRPTFHWGGDSACVRGSFAFSKQISPRIRSWIGVWRQARTAHEREFGWLSGLHEQVIAEAERRAVSLINNGVTFEP